MYEQVKKLDEQSLVDEAKVRRNADRRRIEEESKKRRDIEDDMRLREKQLGIKANVHVASGMEKILEAALKQWSRDVSATLNSKPATQGPRLLLLGRRPGRTGRLRWRAPVTACPELLWWQMLRLRRPDQATECL